MESWIIVAAASICISFQPALAATCANSETVDKVHLVGLLEFNLTPSCTRSEPVSTYSLSLALAAEYMIENVNNNASGLAVPGVSYDLKVEEICKNRSLATRNAALNVPLSLWREQNICLRKSPQSEGEEESLLLGFLGPAYSSTTKYVAEFLNNTRIPVITPSATLAELSDKSKYGSLLRTVTSDDKQSRAIVDVAIKMEWSYVLLVHTNDDYGRQGAAKIRSYGDSKGLCFSQVIELDLYLSNYLDKAKSIKADPAVGVIYFGQEEPALAIIDQYLLLVKPIFSQTKKVFLMSDGVGTATSALERLPDTGDKLGLVVVSPHTNENELEDYIAQRLSGTKNGSAETNKMINQFKKECESRTGCSNDNLLKAADATQQMMNAVVAFAHAFKVTHSNFCGSRSGVCKELGNSPAFYPEMLQSLLSTQISMNVANQNVSIIFDKQGDVDSGTPTPAYSLSVATQADGSWRYTSVGVYHHNGQWTYTNEEDLKSSYLSRCLNDCGVCVKKTTPYVYRRHKSKYIIAGTASVSSEEDQHECGKTVTLNGFVMMESFYYAVEQIRNLTGIDFSTLFIDTCYAKLGTHSIMNGIFKSENQAVLTDPEGKEWEFAPTDFVVFLGDASSGVSLVLQTYLSLYNIPQISYRSTSTWLSDSLRYPMFLRNVPSDAEQTRLMIEVVQKNNWDTVGLIYSDTVYGQTGADLLKKHAREKGVCIAFLETVKNTAESIKNLVLKIKSTAEANKLPRPIIIFAEEALVKDFLARIKLSDTNWKERGNILIGSETWSSIQEIVADTKEFAYGSLTFSFSDSLYSWTVGEKNDFQSYLRTQTPANNDDNPIFMRFWQQYFKCFLPQDTLSTNTERCSAGLNVAGPGADQTLDYEEVVGKNVVMAGLSVAYSLKEATDGEKICQRTAGTVDCSKLFDTEKGRKHFFRFLKETKIPQVVHSNTKTYAPFLENGDGKVNYKVYNIIQQGEKTAFYREVYTITDGAITQKRAPQFYIGGQVDPNVLAGCSSCACLADTTRGLPSANTQTSTSQEDQVQQWEEPVWLLPLLIIIIVFLVILLAVVVVYIVYVMRRRRLQAQKGDIQMHGVDRAGAFQPDLPSLPPLPVPMGHTVNSYTSNPARNGVVNSPNAVPSAQDQSHEYLEFQPRTTSVTPEERASARDSGHYALPDSFSLPMPLSSRPSTSTSPDNSDQSRMFTGDLKAGRLDEGIDGASARYDPAGEEVSSSHSGTDQVRMNLAKSVY